MIIVFYFLVKAVESGTKTSRIGIQHPHGSAKAIRFLLARKRHIFCYEQGRVQPGERLEETEMVEEWLAAHYGWGEPTQAQPSAGPNDESDRSPSEGPVGIIDGDRIEGENSDGGAHDDFLSHR